MEFAKKCPNSEDSSVKIASRDHAITASLILPGNATGRCLTAPHTRQRIANSQIRSASCLTEASLLYLNHLYFRSYSCKLFVLCNCRVKLVLTAAGDEMRTTQLY